MNRKILAMIFWTMNKRLLISIALTMFLIARSVTAQQSPQPMQFASRAAVMAAMQDEGMLESPLGSQSTDATAHTPRISLAQLEQMALDANPSIARMMALVSAGRGNTLQVGLAPNPQTGFEGQQIGSGGRAEQYGVLLGQEFVRRDKLRLNRVVAAAEVQRLEQELSAQRLRVLTDVRMAFYRGLRAQEQLTVAGELVKIAEQAKESADALFKAAEVSRIDVLQAEIETENASILKRNSENRKIAAWQTLAAVTGQSNALPIELEGDLFAEGAEIDFQNTLLNLQQSSPEIAAVMATMERSRANLSRQIVEPRPNVTVQGLVNWRDNGVNGTSDGALAVSLPLPLWNRNQGAIYEARQKLVAAERQLTQVELELQNRLAPVYERYANAVEQVRRYETTILPKAEETLKLTREAYKQGELSFINLLTVQRTNAQSRINYLDAIESLRVAEAEIEGLLLSDSLIVRQ